MYILCKRPFKKQFTKMIMGFLISHLSAIKGCADLEVNITDQFYISVLKVIAPL